MVGRFLAGYHPALGQMGVWLSRPGVEVTTATLESQFLLSSSYKNEQVALTGNIYVPPGESRTVFFPEALDNAPYVSFSDAYADGVNYYPFRIDLVTSSPRSYLVGCHSSTDRVVFSNGTEFSLIFYYRVLARALGT